MLRNDRDGEVQSLLVSQDLGVPSSMTKPEQSDQVKLDYGTATTKEHHRDDHVKEDLLNDRDEEHQLFMKDGRRLHCLDVARIVCVALVAVNHGGSSWSDQFGLWNEMYVQQWVLQWLFVICGISFGMSSRNTPGYLGRLLLYFVIGVFTNWCAWVIEGLNWRDNIWNVVFQFWFIFGLMVYIICLTPMKQYLERISSRRTRSAEFSLTTGIVLVVVILLLVHFAFRYLLGPIMNMMFSQAIVVFSSIGGYGATFWGFPSNPEDTLLFIEELLSYLQVSVGSILILWIFPMVSNRLSLTNWLVLLYVYFFKCLEYRGQFARIIDGFDFTMIGLANFYLGLSYRRTIGKYMCRYWFFVLFVFALLIPPGTWGRFDETSIHDLSFRIRWHMVELILVVLFLSAAERIADSGIFTEDKLGWLSWWALYIFLTHKFIHMVLPQPWNWLALIMTAPIAWLIHGGSAADAKKEKALEDDLEAEKQKLTGENGSDEQKALEEEKQKLTGENGIEAPLSPSQLEGR